MQDGVWLAVRGDLLSGVEGWVSSLNRRPRLCLTVFALLLAAQIRPWSLPELDSCSYLSMARSFAETGHMRNLGSPHLFHFPGYPLVISPLFWISNRPLWLLSAFGWLSAIGVMLGVYWWAKRVVPQWAVLIAGLSVINQGVWIYCARPLTEIPFMCGWVWSANAALAAARSQSQRAAVFRGTLAGCLLALTSMIRPAGIVLAVGFGLHLAWKAISRELSWTRAVTLTLLFGLPGSLALAGFLQSEMATATAHKEETYLNNFEEKTASPLAACSLGVRLTLRAVGGVVVPGMFKAHQRAGWSDFNLFIYVPLSAVLAFGWWRLLMQSRDPILLALPFYVVLHIAHSIDVGPRFYVPLVPVFMASLASLGLMMRRGQALTMGGLLSAHLTMCLIYGLSIDGPRGKTFAAHWRQIDRLARQIDPSRAHVFTSQLKVDDVFALNLTLDRRVSTFDPGRAGDAEWIVAGRTSPDIPGFAECQESASFRLLHRIAPRMASGDSESHVR